MNFLQPTNFAWLLLAVPIILLYCVVLGRRKRQATATMMLWERALARRSRYDGARRWLSLAVVLMLLTLLVLALAEPYFGDIHRRPRDLLLVLDRTASMTAEDGRFKEAIEIASKELNQLEPGDRVGLISFGETIVLHTPPTEQLDAVRKLLNEQTSTDGSADANKAIELATQMLGRDEQARAVVLTDGAIDPARQPLEPRLDWRIVGKAEPNVAITRLATRKATTEGGDDFALVTVRNFGVQSADLSLSVQGSKEPSRLQLSSGERKTMLLPSNSKLPSEAVVQIESAIEDSLTMDNRSSTNEWFNPNTEENRAAIHRQLGESDLTQRIAPSEAEPLPQRGSLPTWLWPAILAAVVVLMAVEFILFQCRMLV